jgi:O-antigen ligase
VALIAAPRYRLALIGLAWLTPLAVHQLVSADKEAVALAAAIWLPALLLITLRAYPSERWGRDLTDHALAPFVVVYAAAATYGLVWGLARGNDPVLALGQSFTAALFVLGFAVAGPALARHATRTFWLAVTVAVAVLSLPGVESVVRSMIGSDAHLTRFLDPVSVLAAMCTLLTLVLVYPRRPFLGAIGAGYFMFATLVTFTRSYWIGLTGALVFSAIVAGRAERWTIGSVRRVTARAAAPVVAVAVCAALVLVATPIGGFVVDRVGEQAGGTGGQAGDLSLTVREHELDAAAAHVRAHPITGLGSGGEYLSLYQTSSDAIRFGDTNFVHNAYLYFPLKFGLLGFAAVAALALGTARVLGTALAERAPRITDRQVFTALLLFLLLASITAPNLVDPRFSFLAGAVAWLAGTPSQGLSAA